MHTIVPTDLFHPSLAPHFKFSSYALSIFGRETLEMQLHIQVTKLQILPN